MTEILLELNIGEQSEKSIRRRVGLIERDLQEAGHICSGDKIIKTVVNVKPGLDRVPKGVKMTRIFGDQFLEENYSLK